ncbi:hypothetical protein LL127_22040 (plasmid) [Clostridium estertheticum]|nr:hypothetical protein [Clostridium estertheticum]MCB2344885.1 hypothetical protein [Clostridium estertheticum]WAG48130.1 hypothetical protein LL127_22040 [Clostridium estertheticum]
MLPQYKIEIKKILDILSNEKLKNNLSDKIFKTGSNGTENDYKYVKYGNI